MPFSEYVEPVGGARILDPSSWKFTNAETFQVANKVWQEIEAEVRHLRADVGSNSAVSATQYTGWFSTLDGAQGYLRPLKEAECTTDLCFGTYVTSQVGPLTKRSCLCRSPGTSE